MESLQQAYQETVQAVIASVSDVMEGEWGAREWRRIVIDHEMLEGDEPQASTIAFSIAERPGGNPEIVDFRLSRVAKKGLRRINEIMKKEKGTFWTICDLTIEADGTYDYRFSYDSPYRLGGNLHDTRFDDYLSRYLAETR